MRNLTFALDQPFTFVPRRVVIFGPDRQMLKALALIVAGLGWRVMPTTRTDDARREIVLGNPCLLIADLKPRDLAALDLIKNARAIGWRGRAVMLSDRPDLIDLEVATRLEVGAILRKPFNLGGLKRAMARPLASAFPFQAMI